MDNGFIFNGRHCREFGLVVESYPTRPMPKRRRKAVTIPGRSGTLYLDEGGYEPVNLTYACWFRGGNLPLLAQADRIAAWLLGAPERSRLSDAYDRNHYLEATFSGPGDIQNILGRFGRVKLTFSCDPRRFLCSGDNPVSLTAPRALFHPTDFPARPVITVRGSGAGTLTVGGKTVEILALEDEITIDCEQMEAHRQGESRNSDIYAPEFPELLPGRNEIAWDGGISSVEIVPRWWTL